MKPLKRILLNGIILYGIDTKHARNTDGGLGLDSYYKFNCFVEFFVPKDEQFLRGVAKWVVAPVHTYCTYSLHESTVLQINITGTKYAF